MTEEEFVASGKVWQAKVLRLYIRKHKRLMSQIRRGDMINYVDLYGIKYLSVFKEILRRHDYRSNPPKLRYARHG